MSREREIIDDGLLCKFYGFTLSEARSLDIWERDVYVRYLNMSQSLESKALKKKSKGGGYGDEE